MAVAILLEGLQAFTPDRHADFYAAMISAGGAMAAILPADFFIRAPKQPTGRSSLRLIAEEWDVPNIGARGSGPQGNAARPQFSLRLRLLKAVPATGE